MLFKTRHHEGILQGRISLTFRTWPAARVNAGRSYRFVGGGALDVSAVDRVPAASITELEATRAGFADRDALLAELAKLGGKPLRRDARVWRVEFRHRDQPDERTRLAAEARLSAQDARMLLQRLERMDGRSKEGPWTRETLGLIAEQPGVVSTKLAEQVGRERFAFKADVRKLKALGLTVSLDVGYELSARGRALVRRLSQPQRGSSRGARRAP